MKHWIEDFEIKSIDVPENFWTYVKPLNGIYDTWSEAHDALIKKVEDLLDEVKNLKPF